MTTPHYKWARFLSIGWTGVILAATLFPIPTQQSLVELTPPWCLVCGDLGLVDIVQNIALFVPLGLALRQTGMSVKQAVGTAAVLSFSIELLQLLVIPGRDGAVSDILTNSTGAWVGAGVAEALPTVTRPSQRTALGLLGAGLLAWLLGLTGTSFLLQPSPPPGPWYGQLAPTAPHFLPFPGEVLSVTLGDVPVSPDMREQPAAFLGGDSLVVTIRSGPPPPGFAPIVILATERGIPIVTVGQHKTTVGVSVRLRASDVRLRSPTLELPEAVPRRSGVTTVIWGGMEDGVLYAGTNAVRPFSQARLALRPSLGWALVSPFRWPGGATTVVALGMLWIGISVFPLAYWAGWARNPPILFTALAGVLVIGLWLIPMSYHLPGTPWYEWVAAAAGLVLGTTSALGLRATARIPARVQTGAEGEHSGPLA